MKGTLIGDASRVFVLRVALASTAFVSDVLLARLLGVEGKGALALLVLTPVLLASLATLGLDYALNQSTHTHPERRNNLTSTAMLLALVAGVVTATIVHTNFLGLGGVLYAAVGALTPIDVLLSAALLISETTFALSLMHAVAAGRPITMGVARLVRRGSVLLVLLVLTLVTTPDVGTTLRLLLAAHLVAILGGAVYALTVSGYRPATPSWQAARTLLPQGARALPGRLAERLQTRVSLLLLGALAGTGSVGLFSVAIGLSEIVFFLSSSLATVLMSRNVETDADVHAAAIRWLLPIGALTAFAMAVAAPFVLARLYGAGFAPVIPLLHWLLPGAVAFSLMHVVSPALIQRGKAQDISLASVTGLVVQVGLILWLVPTGGAGSAAIATLAAYGVSATMVILAYSRDTGRSLQRVLLPTRADVHAAARRLRRRATP